MSVETENATISACPDSFWEPGQYKRVVRRIDDGAKLCQELSQLLKERGEIESQYAKLLRNWAKKWDAQISAGNEYGTTEQAWRSILTEATARCDYHMRVRDRLQEEVCNTIKIFQKDNYHKTALSGLKEAKDADDSFKKVQKPWSKLYAKVEKAKRDYHHSCKQERTATNQERNANNDSTVSPEQSAKLKEKLDKCTEDKEKTKHLYNKALQEINEANPKYMEDMTIEFDRCQDGENKRLIFFKEMLLGAHKCLDMSKDAKIQNIYNEYSANLLMASSDTDIKWWGLTYGTGMAMNWPSFEDYSPELRHISKKQPKNANEQVTLVGHGDESVRQHQRQAAPQINGRMNDTSSTNKQHSHHPSDPPPPPYPTPYYNSNGNGSGGHHTYDPSVNPRASVMTASVDQDEWGDGGVDSVSYPTGVPVRAIYDYQEQEDDELTLSKGDVFEKLEEPDEQGWCKGKKDGRVGLYPANYVELIQAP